MPATVQKHTGTHSQTWVENLTALSSLSLLAPEFTHTCNFYRIFIYCCVREGGERGYVWHVTNVRVKRQLEELGSLSTMWLPRIKVRS